jgi:hypothetical protein
MTLSYRLAAGLSLAALAMILILLMPPQFTNAARPPGGFQSPVLALEFARDLDEVDAILSNAPSIDREIMLAKTRLDYGFIAAYAALFAVMGLLLRRRGGLWKWAGLAAIHLALAAGIFDVAENLAIAAVCHVKLEATTPEMIRAIRFPSRIKWVLAFTAIGLLSPLFLTRRRVFWRALGAIWLLVAAVGLAGVAFRPSWIELAMAPLPVLLFVQAILFWFWGNRRD